MPETCGFAAKAGRFGNALTGCVRLLQQLAHLAQQRLEADAAVFEVGLFGAHQHGVVHEVACERDGLLQRPAITAAIRHDAYKSPVPCNM